MVADLAGHDQARRELAWIGYGQLDERTWVAPHDHAEAARSLLDSHAIDGFVIVGTLDRPDQEVVRRGWDLDDLAEGYRAFADRWQGVDVPEDDAEAFRQRLELVHDWRSFLFVDPGLPAGLLPADWPGHHAAETFAGLYEPLAEPSWRWFHRQAAHDDGGMAATRPGPDTDRSPFARGLDALQSGPAG